MKPFLILSPLLLFSCTKPAQSSPPHSQKPILKQSKPIDYGKLEKYNTRLHFVSFNTTDYQIEVADQPKGPGSLWKDAKAAAHAQNALVAINAGFFSPEGKPVGLCIDDSKKTGYLNTSSLGSGALIVQPNLKTFLPRRKNSPSYKNPLHMLQSGPFLVDHGKVINVKTREARPRSFIAWDGKDNWVIGHIEHITMANMATWLATSPFPNFKLEYALNLDGGRSCEFYLHKDITGKEKQISTLLNRKVRNFIVVKKK